MDGRLVNYDESRDSPNNTGVGGGQTNNRCPVDTDISTSLVSEIPESLEGISAIPAPLAPTEISASSENPASAVGEMPPISTRDPLISMALDLVGAEQVSEEMKMKMEEIRIHAGNDPDIAEVEQLTLPEPMAVNADLHHLRRRSVFVSPLTMGEFSHPNILEVMAHCHEFKVSFIQRSEATGSQSSWEGCMTFRMQTLSDAKEAVLHLQDIRSDLTVRLLKINENVYDVMEKWHKIVKTSSAENCKETNRLLIVNNLPAGVTEAKLQHLFSDALEIIIMAKNQSGKCFAYLMFSGEREMKEAYTKYTSKNINYDGCLLRIHKYESPKKIPEGFLQLGERFRVLSLLEHFITKYDASSALSIPVQLQHKIKDAISCLLSLANLDANARKFLGLPVFSLEELHLLLDMPRSPGTVDLLPVTELLTMFSTEQDRLKESVMARKFHGNFGEQDMMQSDNSVSCSERKDKSSKIFESPHARSRLPKGFENMVQRGSKSFLKQNRLPRSPRRATPFPSMTARKRSTSESKAVSKRSKSSGPSGRDRHLRQETTAVRSYSSYRRTGHLWGTRSHRISRYCTKILPHDHRVREPRVVHSSRRRL